MGTKFNGIKKYHTLINQQRPYSNYAKDCTDIDIYRGFVKGMCLMIEGIWYIEAFLFSPSVRSGEVYRGLMSVRASI